VDWDGPRDDPVNAEDQSVEEFVTEVEENSSSNSPEELAERRLSAAPLSDPARLVR